MDVLTSTEFRKVYPALRRVTMVTVNGHVIGQWQPFLPVDVVGEPHLKRPEAYFPEPVTPPGRPMTQTERDAILRKINRAGR